MSYDAIHKVLFNEPGPKAPSGMGLLCAWCVVAGVTRRRGRIDPAAVTAIDGTLLCAMHAEDEFGQRQAKRGV